MKYLKIWLGSTAGSFTGSKDGNLEQKFRYYNSIDELSKDYGKQPGEQYYEIKELNPQSLKFSVMVALENQNKKVN